jgi:hypothetical protein
VENKMTKTETAGILEKGLIVSRKPRPRLNPCLQKAGSLKARILSIIKIMKYNQP